MLQMYVRYRLVSMSATNWFHLKLDIKPSSLKDIKKIY